MQLLDITRRLKARRKTFFAFHIAFLAMLCFCYGLSMYVVLCTGARRWQIGMDCNSLSLKQAVLNIYPRQVQRHRICADLICMVNTKSQISLVFQSANVSP
jgi:hypothetical protein